MKKEKEDWGHLFEMISSASPTKAIGIMYQLAGCHPELIADFQFILDELSKSVDKKNE